MNNLNLETLMLFIEKFNIPKDAEIWIEYPVKYGIIQGSEKDPTFEHTESKQYNESNDWIIATTLAYSREKNKIYICHHY